VRDPTATDPGGGAGASGATRFAPAPTGYLHLGHVANAVFVWGLAGATGRRVVVRIEDHDRQRSRAAFDAALLHDLAWLGFMANSGPVRQSDDWAPYGAALERLDRAGLVYACDCARSTFTAWARAHGKPWSGAGCPGGCRARGVRARPGVGLRVVLGNGEEAWDDERLGRQRDAPNRAGDLLVHDRHGNWTYPFCVVVDDHRQAIDLVVRGEDLLDATASQIRLGRLLGRDAPPAFYHHPLIRKPGGAKLSKSDGDTGVRDLRERGLSAQAVIGEAAAAVGLLERARPLAPDDLAGLFG
jgi:glutamyl/glutaminyl-tRNA synthetase